jgi:hypothetical protein
VEEVDRDLYCRKAYQSSLLLQSNRKIHDEVEMSKIDSVLLREDSSLAQVSGTPIVYQFRNASSLEKASGLAAAAKVNRKTQGLFLYLFGIDGESADLLLKDIDPADFVRFYQGASPVQQVG